MLAFACALTVQPKVLDARRAVAGFRPNTWPTSSSTVSRVNASGVSVLMVEQNAIEALRIPIPAW
jgi:ABC-type branched-subunit amino acid transport system ATPase component